jgi:hypothetical protein
MLFGDFLERVPPGVFEDIEDLCEPSPASGAGIQFTYTRPDIQLYCDSDKCKGMRYFACKHTPPVGPNFSNEMFISYFCRNCEMSVKIFALKTRRPEFSSVSGKAIKFGEFPPFGPHVPSRLISLIGPDREIFLKGRRSENQGLGIGAFAYYRRVIENQKGRLIEEIAKVAKRLGASQDVLDAFERAHKETQFSKAIDDIKAAIPQALLIDGHNPLMLLHSALSEGLHAGTDEECLEAAEAIRLVLTELAERISQALKDESELMQAVTRLMQKKQKPTNSNPLAPDSPA